MRKKQNASSFKSNKTAESLNEQIIQASEVLLRGGVVAFPTETCYGLAVDPFNISAVKRLYKLKKRDYSKPILILINSEEQLNYCIKDVPAPFQPLIDKYWPGPLTFVFPASSKIPDIVSGGTGSIAIRKSPHFVPNRLIELVENPITATSANLSSEKVALTASDCLTIFGDDIDYIIDNKEKGRDSFSTIVGLANNQLKIFRQGELEIAEITR